MKDLIEEQEEDSEDRKTSHDGKSSKSQRSNIILMEVEVPGQQRNIIGGYASHQWKANNSCVGDETCFLFNLTQNLRFNARKREGGVTFYQKTEIVQTSKVKYI